MEIDLYTNNERELAQKDYEPPSDSTHYSSSEAHALLPLRNIIFDETTDLILHRLQSMLEIDSYYKSRISVEKLEKLSDNLKRLFNNFVSRDDITPVRVRGKHAIVDPSPSGHLKGDHSGLGAPMINKYPVLNDKLYQVVEGHEQVAMSQFFKYDHVPVIVN